MYASDLKHSNTTLKSKLENLYNLNRGERLAFGFRPQYTNLLEKLGNPHLHLPPIIHVAGTNGKGSVIAFLKSILESSGKGVHTYTSPHLHHFNERIVLNGSPIKDTYLEKLIDEAIKLNNNADISFFEITTALAFKAFADNPADILLLEVGLGGRLDCTNIIPAPALSIINTISMDHMEFLGNTLDEIATEKAGIIKQGTPCILGQQNCDPNLFQKIAKTQDAPLHHYGSDWFTTITEKGFDLHFQNATIRCPTPNLQGLHQIHNAGLAVTALKLLSHLHPISEHHIASGLQNATWPARLENITSRYNEAKQKNWTIFYDGGHNEGASKILASEILQWKSNKSSSKNVHLILGMMTHKDPASFIKPLLPLIKTLTITDIPDEPHSLKAKELENILKNETIIIKSAKNPKEAIQTIINTNKTAGTILITGSLYLASHL